MKKLFVVLFLASSRLFAADLNCQPTHAKIVSDRLPEIISGYQYDVYNTLWSLYSKINVEITQQQVKKFATSYELISDKIVNCGKDKDCVETIIKFTPRKEVRVENGNDIRDFTMKFNGTDSSTTVFITELQPTQAKDAFGEPTGWYCQTKSYERPYMATADLIYVKNNSKVGLVFFNQGPVDVKTPFSK